jgi:hypothetical protein
MSLTNDSPNQTLEEGLRSFAAGLPSLISSENGIFNRLSVQKLPGDASNRAYYRLGRAPASCIAMVMPKEAAKSEEGGVFEAPKELPFINIHRYLKQLGIRVPAILRFDPQAGWMLLEDLGNQTLGQKLKEEPSFQTSLYEQAVDLLANLRFRAEQHNDSSCIAFSRKFDADLYDWELHHFREWGLEARYQVTLSPGERSRVNMLFRELAQRLQAEPSGFTHRDYQSRNIMIHQNELAVIDFQDALLGPREYDLVALMRDSYVSLEREFIEKMVSRYIDSYAQAGGVILEKESMLQTFDWLTIQRKLKDAGRFEFIARTKGNMGFLPFVQPSLAYVRAAMEKLAGAAELRDVLAKHVPELR